MGYGAHQMVDKYRDSPTHLRALDWLRRIGPAHFSHINFRGTMRFGVEKYGGALVQRGPVHPARVAS